MTTIWDFGIINSHELSPHTHEVRKLFYIAIYYYFQYVVYDIYNIIAKLYVVTTVI